MQDILRFILNLTQEKKEKFRYVDTAVLDIKRNLTIIIEKKIYENQFD